MSHLHPATPRPTPSRSTLGAGLLGLALVLSAACGGAPAPASGDGASDAAAPSASAGAALPSLEEARSLRIPNANQPHPLLLTAGALTPEGMEALAESGYSSFISLRSPEEDGSGWEEEFAASSGVAFQRVTVAGAAGLTRENVEALDALLDEAGDDPTVLYCGSSNRVGALLALRAHWLDGIDPDSALALGRASGLSGLEPAVAGLMTN